MNEIFEKMEKALLLERHAEDSEPEYRSEFSDDENLM